MSLPRFYELMLPLLELARDGAKHSMQAAVDRLAERFKLTDEERDMLYLSGKKTDLYRSRMVGANLSQRSRAIGVYQQIAFQDNRPRSGAAGRAAR